MIKIRPFREEDNQSLLNIEKLCPQGDKACSVLVDKRPDITARYRLYDNWEILVAYEDEKIAGWTGWTVKNEREKRYVYLAEIMVHPDFRGHGVASRLIKEAEKAATKVCASHIYCYIYGPNKASMGLFEKNGYILAKNVNLIEMSAYKKRYLNGEYDIERMKNDHFSEVVELINKYYMGRTHFLPFTPEEFRAYINRIPGYGSENLFVVKKDNNVVACSGLWDTSLLMEMAYINQPFMWRVMENAYGLLRYFIPLQRIPARGEFFKFHCIVDHAFKEGHGPAMEELFKFFNNIIYDKKCEFFGVYLDPGDQLINIAKGFKTNIETAHIYAKTISWNMPDFNYIYVDYRDPLL